MRERNQVLFLQVSGVCIGEKYIRSKNNFISNLDYFTIYNLIITHGFYYLVLKDGTDSHSKSWG